MHRSIRHVHMHRTRNEHFEWWNKMREWYFGCNANCIWCTLINSIAAVQSFHINILPHQNDEMEARLNLCFPNCFPIVVEYKSRSFLQQTSSFDFHSSKSDFSSNFQRKNTKIYSKWRPLCQLLFCAHWLPLCIHRHSQQKKQQSHQPTDQF